MLVDELSAQMLPGACFKLTENLFGIDGILDIGKISVLLENFHRTTGMANAIVDRNGNILCGVGWKSICTDFHRKNKRCLERCLRSDTIQANQLACQERYALYVCENGMVDAATPIIIGNEHIANLFIGQFFLETPDQEYFVKQAEEFGFDQTKYLEALSACSIYSKETIYSYLDFLRGLTSIIGEAALEKSRREALVTELMEIKNHLEATNKELEAFSYSVSHDLKAPLRHITGYLSLFQDDYLAAIPEDGQRYLKNAETAAIEMGKLIDGLLGFTRSGKVDIEYQLLDMNDIISALIKPIQDRDTENKIEFRVSPLPKAYGDLEMFKSVWGNLLDNAVKFSRTRERIEINIGAQEGNDETIYYIQDNGVGFNEAYASKLFTIFQRLHNKDEYEGTGIGLAILKRVMTRHGGRIWAESVSGEGATFYFSLPNRKECT